MIAYVALFMQGYIIPFFFQRWSDDKWVRGKGVFSHFCRIRRRWSFKNIGIDAFTFEDA
jgi:hypothetical protein